MSIHLVFRRRTSSLALLAGLCALFGSSLVRAQAPQDDATGLRAEIVALEQRLSQLEYRLARALETGEQENSVGPLRVVGSLEVVDDSGQPIMRVGPSGSGVTRGAYFYNSSGEIVATVTALQDRGGLMKVLLAGDSETFADLYATSQQVAFSVRRGGVLRAQLGQDESGQVAASVFDAQGRVTVRAGHGSQDDAALNVIGPVKIDDMTGHPIAKIGPAGSGLTRGAYFYNSSGRPVATITAPQDQGGLIKALDAQDPNTYADLVAIPSLVGLNIRIADALAAQLRADAAGEGLLDLYRRGESSAQLGSADGRHTALRVFGGAGIPVASIGVDDQGHGGVRVGAPGGNTVASLYSGVQGGAVYVLHREIPVAGIVVEEAGNGTVAVYNHARTPIAYLTASSGGDGGNLTLARNDGFGLFSAGAAQDGGGEACINRRTQAGSERLTCLGIGLPSAGMGK